MLWQVLGELGDARTDWFRMTEPAGSSLLYVDPPLKPFAQEHVTRLDQDGRPIPIGRSMAWVAFPWLIGTSSCLALKPDTL